MIIDNLSQIQAVEISRGIYGTKTFLWLLPLYFFSSKIEGFFVCVPKKYACKHTGGCTILRHVFYA